MQKGCRLSIRHGKNHKTHLIAVGFDDVGKSLQKGQRHEFNPSVVAMADRMLITVWIMIFQVSLFFIGSLVKGFVFSLFYFGCWLLAVSCWLLAVSYWPLAIGRLEDGKLNSRGFSNPWKTRSPRY